MFAGVEGLDLHHLYRATAWLTNVALHFRAQQPLDPSNINGLCHIPRSKCRRLGSGLAIPFHFPLLILLEKREPRASSEPACCRPKVIPPIPWATSPWPAASAAWSRIDDPADEQAVQDGEEHRALQRELMPPRAGEIGDHVAAAGLFPQPLEHQHTSAGPMRRTAILIAASSATALSIMALAANRAPRSRRRAFATRPSTAGRAFHSSRRHRP